MARLLIYDNYTDRVFTYPTVDENDSMPYSTESTLLVREFRGSRAAPPSDHHLRHGGLEPDPPPVWPGHPCGVRLPPHLGGGHGTRSQHYAGVSFDVGQTTTAEHRTEIFNAALRTGAWGYVEPLSLTPTWVHFDRRYGVPACSGTTSGYPTLRRGSRGCYVMILQDALSTLGYPTGERIDGVFGVLTENALKGYQRRNWLTADGVCGCNSWAKISTSVLGVGRTATTID